MLSVAVHLRLSKSVTQNRRKFQVWKQGHTECHTSGGMKTTGKSVLRLPPGLIQIAMCIAIIIQAIDTGDIGPMKSGLEIIVARTTGPNQAIIRIAGREAELSP